MNEPAVLLMAGKGIYSTLIKWQTWSDVSHAAFLLPDGNILEAWQGAGVRIRDYPAGPGIEVYTIPDITEAEWKRVLDFAKAQVGKKYDYMGIFRFLTREKSEMDDKWFCSELVFEAFKQAGIHLLERIKSYQVSPGILKLSPRLHKYGS